jgi:hypothetical protein
MTKKSENLHPLQPGRQLHAPMRLIAAGALQLWFLYCFTNGGAVGIGGQFSDMAKEFVFVLVPTITILFLLPVIIWGSRSQKILAIVLSLFPAWLAFQDWSGIVVDHVLN